MGGSSHILSGIDFARMRALLPQHLVRFLDNVGAVAAAGPLELLMSTVRAGTDVAPFDLWG